MSLLYQPRALSLGNSSKKPYLSGPMVSRYKGQREKDLGHILFQACRSLGYAPNEQKTIKTIESMSISGFISRLTCQRQVDGMTKRRGSLVNESGFAKREIKRVTRSRDDKEGRAVVRARVG